MNEHRRCGCGAFAGWDGYCRNCRPHRPCLDYPPTCAPYRGVCCMDEDDVAVLEDSP